MELRTGSQQVGVVLIHLLIILMVSLSLESSLPVWQVISERTQKWDGISEKEEDVKSRNNDEVRIPSAQNLLVSKLPHNCFAILLWAIAFEPHRSQKLIGLPAPPPKMIGEHKGRLFQVGQEKEGFWDHIPNTISKSTRLKGFHLDCSSFSSWFVLCKSFFLLDLQ